MFVGSTWENVQNGVQHAFSSQGSALKYKVTFTTANEKTPTLYDIALVYVTSDLKGGAAPSEGISIVKVIAVVVAVIAIAIVVGLDLLFTRRERQLREKAPPAKVPSPGPSKSP